MSTPEKPFSATAPGSVARFPCGQALAAVAAVRRENQICISNQMSARLWPYLSQHPLDLNYLSSTMGGAIPLGLGLALARPDYEVIVLSGDGSLLMSLGSLVSVTGSGAANLTIVLLDNGQYEVTGGQATPGRLARVDFAALARAAGFPTAADCSDLASWRACLDSAWHTPGPRLFAVSVLPVPPDARRCTTTRVADELRRLTANLATRPKSDPG